MKNNKVSIVLILFVLTLFSCRKTPLPISKTELEQRAYEILSEKMSHADFNALNWQEVRIEHINGKPALLKVKHKGDPNKVLLFGILEGFICFNWVEINIAERNRGSVRGIIILKDLDNKVLNRFNIYNGNGGLGIQRPELLSGSSGEPGDLPEVTVIGYTNNEPSAWWSLYWLFNANMQWFSQYTQSAYLDPNCTNCFGGIDVLPIDELYPETPEILLFEHDYLGLMSQEEVQIYNGMSRSQQLKYLWNAHRAINVSQAAYPAPYHNGKADAFRHAYFSALNAEALGTDLATALGNAHEMVPGAPALEREMDLRNNQIGRDIYLLVFQLNLGSHFFKEGCAIKVHELLQNGELWYLRPLGPNGEIIPGITELVRTNQ